MAQKTRAQIQTANAALFTANGAKAITGPLEKAFNEDFADSVAFFADITEDITVTPLRTLVDDGEIQIGKKYRITDATAGVVWVWGVDSNVVSSNAALEGTWDGTTLTVGAWGYYDLENDVGYFNLFDNLSSDGPFIATFSVDGIGFTSVFISNYTYASNGRVLTVSVNGNITFSSVSQGVLTIPIPSGFIVGDTFVGYSVTFRDQTFQASLTECNVEKNDGSSINWTIDGSTNGAYDFCVVANIYLG
jgi:hypothetical protein